MKHTTITYLLLVALLAFFTGCGGSSSDAPTTQEIAIDKMKAYTKGGNAPTLQDYLDAGVVGVTADNLAQINEVVENLTEEEVDTTEEIQALANALGVQVNTDSSPVAPTTSTPPTSTAPSPTPPSPSPTPCTNVNPITGGCED